MPNQHRLPRLRALLAVAGAFGLLLAGGCATGTAITDPAERGPFFQARNFTGVPALPAAVRRVVVLPVAGAPGVPVETLASFDPIIAAELQRQARFEVVPVDADTLMRICDRPRLLSADALPAGLLAALAQDYQADAVLFVDVTAFAPYPPLVLGFRGKLAQTSDGAILWAFDTIFSAHDPAVVNSARRYALEGRSPSLPGDAAYSVLRSPARFAQYVTAAAFATLPRLQSDPILAPRNPPASRQ